MANYDGFAEEYNAIVNKGGPENSYRYILTLLKSIPDIQNKSVCDIGCGQGELSSRISLLGASVTGVDVSKKLLQYARSRSNEITWIQDDAMELNQLPNESFDIVVSSLMLMDVPDHSKVFEATYRILKPDGIMIWAITHPCFQSPFSYPVGDGSRNVMQYSPQFWKSEGKGTIRSTLGAYHRPLSTYINDFINTGFSLERIDEPERDDKSIDLLPLILGVVGRRITK